MTRRQERLGDLIREELGQALLHHLRDPRLSGLVTITRVEVTPDLRWAKVFISVLGDEGEKDQVMKGMASAAGFLRRYLSQVISLRRTPQLTFHRNDSIQEGLETLQLIKRVSGQENGKAGTGT